VKTAFKESFLKDLKSVKDRRLLARVKNAIEAIEAAPTLSDIPSIKSLRGTKNYFRFRIGSTGLG